MIEQEEPGRDLATLVVPLAGRLVATGDRWEPYRLLDAGGVRVVAAGAYFGHLQAAGRSELTIRSYGMDLLRWFRFLWAIGVPWSHAVRSDARDFCRWLQVAGKPVRPHWREQDRHGAGQPAAAPGVAYSPSVRAHCETVLRSFYDFHVEAGSGPLVNPFPLDRSRGLGGRTRITIRWSRSAASAAGCTGRRCRRGSRGTSRMRSSMRSSRRWVRTGTGHWSRSMCPRGRGRRTSATRGGVDPGRQLITVVHKGTRAVQQLPASADAFVWLRLYQAEMDGGLPRGSGQPLWWTLRRPFRPLTYHAVHRMFERAGTAAGTDATLHSLRHTAAYRMAEDPALPLTDVQFVLGHALLTTTQLYMTPRKEEVIRRVLAHHGEQVRQARRRARPAPAPGYRPETLDVLFGKGTS
jgi:site-specific recombinase XerD